MLFVGRYTIVQERKKQDAWIGAFWRREQSETRPEYVNTDLWLCLIPCFPLHVSWSSLMSQEGKRDGQ